MTAPAVCEVCNGERGEPMPQAVWINGPTRLCRDCAEETLTMLREALAAGGVATVEGRQYPIDALAAVRSARELATALRGDPIFTEGDE